MKVLIWNDFILKARKGGPTTYLYNLRESVKANEIDNVTFLNNKEAKEKLVSSPKFTNFYKKHIVSNLFRLLKGKDFEAQNRKKKIISRRTSPGKLPAEINLDDYTHIHFHTTSAFYKNAHLLKDFKGKTLLTSHSPKATHMEVIEEFLSGIELNEEEKQKFEEVDRFSFENADYVVFPCKEAQEPYFNSWDKYKDITLKNDVKEFLTCTLESKITLNREEVFAKYNIPEDAFVITYFGRHNEVKGYDILKALGEQILPKHKNVYFLLAGKEAPIAGLNHERWIEVGWTQDPHSIVGASDLYILPNRETFFDLALLEVLSIGTVSLVSNTGGNKYFKRLPEEETKGMLFFDQNDLNDLESKFNQVYSGSYSKEWNKELFEKYFNNSHFAPNYLKMIGELK